MKKKLKKKLLIITAMMAVIVLFSGLATYAETFYMLKGKLTKGIYNRKFYHTFAIASLKTASEGAIADWNWAVNSNNNGWGPDVYFTKTTVNADAQVKFWMEPISNIKIVGETRFYNGSTKIDMEKVYEGDWTSCNVFFNEKNYTTLSQVSKRSVMCHELGHVFGLTHHPTNTGVIMYEGVDVRTAVSPTGYDVRAVSSKY